jgi:trehalose 2-sulfotransferase
MASFPIAYDRSGHEARLTEHFGADGLRVIDKSLPAGLRTYVICFTNRCGSNYLADLLSTHPALGRAGEYLNSLGVISVSNRLELKSLQEYLEWLARKKASGQGVLGVKLDAGQLLFLTRTGLMPRAFGDVRFIHMRRLDVLAQAVSHSIAFQNKAWTSNHETRKPDEEISFNERQITGMTGRIHEANAKFRAFFDIYGLKPIDVVYEELTADPQAVGDRVLRELGYAELRGGSVRPEAVSISRQANELNRSFTARIRAMYDAFHPRTAA